MSAAGGRLLAEAAAAAAAAGGAGGQIKVYIQGVRKRKNRQIQDV